MFIITKENAGSLIMRKYKYPPDDPTTGEYTVSVNKVLDQAELLADFWTKDK